MFLFWHLCLCFRVDFGLCLCLVWVSVFVFVFWHGFRALFAIRVRVSGVGFGLCISGWVSSLGFSWLFSIWVAHIFAFFFFPSFSNLDFAHISARFFFCFFFFLLWFLMSFGHSGGDATVRWFSWL